MNTLSVVLLIVALSAVAALVVVLVLWRKNVRAKDEAAGREHDALTELRAKYESELKSKADVAEENRRREAEHAREIEALKDAVANITNEKLRESSVELTAKNSKEIENAIKPLRERIKELNDHMVENKTSIEEQVKALTEANVKTNTAADNLAEALTRKPKTQGDWGERQLTACLLAQGLIEGVNFVLQPMLSDESGKKQKNRDSDKMMRPDALLYLDNDNFLLVDAKTTLKAYVAYSEATTEKERDSQQDMLVESVKNHIRELADKDYSFYGYEGRTAVDFVLMFVPNEGALQLFLQSKNGREIWYEAMKRKVFIVGERNLYAVSRLVSLLWIHQQQENNCSEIFRQVDELLKRVARFQSRFAEIGKGITALQTAYDNASTTLQSEERGNHSVIGQAKKIAKLDGNYNHELKTLAVAPEVKQSVGTNE